MSPDESAVDLPSETTEQALARVEAECGWSDIGRFAETPESGPAVAAIPAVPAAPADRSEA